ncbi:hypothetical protein IWQ47_001638 [Aquimarina sp. EL_43]|uniref:hypothetical protein n=1 Tax=unclassified Aquimarina TaxID=2627091 RepID=UPI0018CB33D1|nr:MULTISPECIES: hypothetical protein [unclassified Aquimarina]MBG6130279.1 hypothetical protein [Aquimarina sp. EL_35]MBG6149059.1 hypothetical protein [Aquimarina sp. EL_32]MBG6168567.1 hypothetical protein [Aquimarina sp. EL_43]
MKKNKLLSLLMIGVAVLYSYRKDVDMSELDIKKIEIETGVEETNNVISTIFSEKFLTNNLILEDLDTKNIPLQNVEIIIDEATKTNDDNRCVTYENILLNEGYCPGSNTEDLIESLTNTRITPFLILDYRYRL